MNSRKTIIAILGGVALTTVIGFLLTFYKGSSTKKKIVKKARDYADIAEESIKDSVVNGKKQVKKIAKTPTE